MPSPLKQSKLAFSSKVGSVSASTSKVAQTEAIVIDDDDDDGDGDGDGDCDGDHFATPPPPLQPAKQDRGIVVEVLGLESSEEDGLKKPSVILTKERDTKKARASIVSSKEMGLDQKGPHASQFPDILSVNAPLKAAKEKRVEGADSIHCHQHRAQCSTPLLRCTYVRTNGVRCVGRYCFATVQKVYRQDPDQILKAGRNIPGVDASEHTGANEANYLWKCPKCRNNCQCSVCRQKKGMESLGLLGRRDLVQAEPSSPAQGSKTLKRDATDLADRQGKSKKGKARAKDGQKSSNNNSSLINGFTKIATSHQQGDAHLTSKPKPILQQQTFQKPLKKPETVMRPTLQSMYSRLPIPNVMARVWLYESLIRFDIFNIPKGVLTQLDKFDDWTEGLLQIILERLICRVAMISNIRATPSRLIHKKLVEAFRITGNDLGRGEAWATAKKYCQSKEICITELEKVDILPHQRGHGRKGIKVDTAMPTQTLLEGRATRSRRLAETQALERVKALSARELEDSEEDDAMDVRSDGEEEGEEEEEEEEEEGEEYGKEERDEDDLSHFIVDDDEEDRPRQARRKREAVAAERGGRGIATRRSARQRGIAVLASSSNSEDRSDGEEEEDDSREIVSHEGNEEEKEEVDEDEAHANQQPASPILAPEFEERVAILSGLVEALIQSKEVNEEINSSAKYVALLEKAAKEEEKELMKASEEEMQAMNSNAPSMTLVEEYSQWKKEKKELEREQAYALLDCRVHSHLQIDAHKSRSGPLGVDCDGNEYWQLSEYVESKPLETSNRWAWSLLIFGKTFYQPPPPPAAAAEPEKKPEEQVDGTGSGNSEIKSSNGLVPIVLIDMPSKGRATDVAKDMGEQVKEEQMDEFSTPPPPPYTAAKEAGESENTVMGISCTNEWSTIDKVIEYIRYRLELREYEEWMKDRQEEEIAIRGNLEGAAKGSSNTQMVSNAVQLPQDTEHHLQRGRRQRRVDLREKQEARKKMIEALIKKLLIVKQYYQWHSEGND